MKTGLILLSICLLPIMICSINPRNVSSSTEQAQSILSMDSNNPMELIAGIAQLPVMPLSKDRNWRLREFVKQKILVANGQLQDFEKNVVFYNADNPAKIDSVYFYVANHVTFVMELTYNCVFTYDDTGEYVVRIDLYSHSGGFTYHSNWTIQYDAQNRMAHLYKYTMLNQNCEYSKHWFYNNDGLIGSCFWVRMDIEVEGTYYVANYTQDAQGRIVGGFNTSTPDSSSISNDGVYFTQTYHPNDSSSGTAQIDYISHDLIGADLVHSGLSDGYGMVAEQVCEYWIDNALYSSVKFVSDYDENNRLTSITKYDLGTVWYENNLNTYTYDNNGNEYQQSYFTWNTTDDVWVGPSIRYNYTWESTTDADDETITPAALNLSVYPNPFRDNLNVSFQSKSIAPIETDIYNLKGQLVKSLGTSKSTSFTWDSKDKEGRAVCNGIYFIKAKQNGKTITNKIIKMK